MLAVYVGLFAAALAVMWLVLIYPYLSDFAFSIAHIMVYILALNQSSAVLRYQEKATKYP